MHQADHGILCVFIEFGTVRILQPKDMPCDLDRCDLETETYAQERDFVLTCIARSLDLPFDTPVPEPTRDQDTMNIR